MAVEAVEQFSLRGMVGLEEERPITTLLLPLAALEHLVKVTLEEAFKPELVHPVKAAQAAADLVVQAVMSITP